MKKIFLFLLTAVFAAAAPRPAFSASLEELTGPERAAILRSQAGMITEVQQKNPGPRLLPRHDELTRLVGETQGGLEPNILVETLYLYRKPLSPRGGAGWNAEIQTGLFNQLVSLSTLAGIEYYSESRKSMRVFYESSYVTDGPAGKKPLPDPVYAAAPGALTLYARQKDLTFGENIYRYDYRVSSGAIFFVQENYTSMNAGIIPAIGKNKFRTVMAVIDSGDYLLLYAAAMAKTVSVPGMGERIGKSFTNRAIAILGWFAERSGGVFKN